MGERENTGMESEPIFRKTGIAVPINGIPLDRMSHIRHMSPYLVFAARLKLTLRQVAAAAPLDNPESGDSFFSFPRCFYRILRIFQSGDIGPVLPVIRQGRVNNAGRWKTISPGIMKAHATVQPPGDKFLPPVHHDIPGLFGAGKHHYPRRFTVQAVDGPDPDSAPVSEHAGEYILRAFTAVPRISYGKYPRGFVDNNKITVLKENPEGTAAFHLSVPSGFRAASSVRTNSFNI
jgi:hypothetical protein